MKAVLCPYCHRTAYHSLLDLYEHANVDHNLFQDINIGLAINKLIQDIVYPSDISESGGTRSTSGPKDTTLEPIPSYETSQKNTLSRNVGLSLGQCKPFGSWSPSVYYIMYAKGFEAQHYLLLHRLNSLPDGHLLRELRSIYTNLIWAQTHCIYENQAYNNSKLNSEHWRTLVMRHQALFNLYHDFLLTSYHPSASLELKRLPEEWLFAAQLWQFAIHPLLQRLRKQLSSSIDHLTAYIHFVYQMFGLFYEIAPTMKESWIESLGNVAWYYLETICKGRADSSYQETWENIARAWDIKAADRKPSNGYFYQRLALLAHPNSLQQLYYYARSLTCVQPFPHGREMVLSMLNNSSVLDPVEQKMESVFTRLHEALFKRLYSIDFANICLQFDTRFDSHIIKAGKKWKEDGVHIAMVNIAGWFDYGAEDDILRQLFLLHNWQSEDGKAGHTAFPLTYSEIRPELEAACRDFTFCGAFSLTMSTFWLVLRHTRNRNVFPHVYVILTFFVKLACIPCIARVIDQAPWAELISFLNSLLEAERVPRELIRRPMFDTAFSDEFPLPEDFVMRGQVWCENRYPDGWFPDEVDEVNRSLQLPNADLFRPYRILQLGYKLSTVGKLSYICT